jgi:hypothetical protein
MMNEKTRFNDDNLSITHFYKTVLVKCTSCNKKAICEVNFETQLAKFFCINCGYNKEVTIKLSKNTAIQMAANQYFNAELWLKHNFKQDIFWAYNYTHLNYLESYISSLIREHKDRTHFTLIEKLPKFYHVAKNRDGLLKIIAKLKTK